LFCNEVSLGPLVEEEFSHQRLEFSPKSIFQDLNSSIRVTESLFPKLFDWAGRVDDHSSIGIDSKSFRNAESYDVYLEEMEIDVTYVTSLDVKSV